MSSRAVVRGCRKGVAPRESPNAMATGRLNADRTGVAGIDLAIERKVDGRMAVRSSMMDRLW